MAINNNKTIKDFKLDQNVTLVKCNGCNIPVLIEKKYLKSEQINHCTACAIIKNITK